MIIDPENNARMPERISLEALRGIIACELSFCIALSSFYNHRERRAPEAISRGLDVIRFDRTRDQYSSTGTV